MNTHAFDTGSVSRLILGAGEFGTSIDDVASGALIEHYLASGGTMLDTARVYGDWVADAPASASEKMLGRWLAANPDLRHRLQISTKGAHQDLRGDPRAPRVSAADIAADLAASRENLGIEQIDLYWLHRDDPAAAVEPILDALFEAVDAGAIAHFGASNWTHARIEEANAYASSCGREGFVADQISYAYIRPQTPGGVGADADESMLFLAEGGDEWYAAHPEVRLVAYSSQARGYMSKLLSGATMPPSIARTYDSPFNRVRAAHAAEVAAELDVPIEAIGVAYLLHRPFPVHAVIGPRTVEQLDATVQAARIVLDDRQLARLDDVR